jgi:hypothetical protein
MMQRWQHDPLIAATAQRLLPQLALLLLLGLLAGCGSTSHPAKSGPDWRTELGHMQQANAIFSLSYAAEPPQGTQLRIALHQDDTATACGFYASADGADASNFWYLGVALNHTTVGDYGIVPELSTTGEVKQASVRLVHVLEGKKAAKFGATEGAVQLKQSPADLEEWKSGTTLTAIIDVGFPASPSTEVECRGNQSLTTGETSTECTCSDEAGVLSICTSPDGNGCCYGSGPSVRLKVDMTAQQCGFMCVATDASLSRYCIEGQ